MPAARFGEVTGPGKRWLRAAALLAMLYGAVCAAAACSREPVPAPGPPPAGEPASAPLRRGHLVFGHEVRAFRPCGTDDALWVVDATGGELWDVFRSLVPGTGAPGEVYVELRGERGTPPGQGFGADYPAALTVSALHYAEGEGRGCSEERRYLWRASGNEPFWTAIVAEDAVTFRTPEEPDGLRLAAPTRERTGRATIVTARDGAHTIELILSPEACRDTMVGSWYANAARVTLDDRTYAGCAR